MAHKIREVYIVHHSHTDVGYTDLQEQVIYNQANNIRRAVELIEEGLVLRRAVFKGCNEGRKKDVLRSGKEKQHRSFCKLLKFQ